MKSFSPQFSITNAITRDLTGIERARGFFAAATLSDRRTLQRDLKRLEDVGLISRTGDTNLQKYWAKRP